MRTLLVLFLLVSFLVQGQSFLSLEELDITNSEQVFQAPVKNEAVHGGALTVDGKTYDRGLGVYAPFRMKIKLNGAHRFRTKIGVLDQSIDLNGPDVQSIPLTDGQKLYYAIDSRKKQFLGVGSKEDGIDHGSVVFKIVHKGKEIFVHLMLF